MERMARVTSSAPFAFSLKELTRSLPLKLYQHLHYLGATSERDGMSEQRTDAKRRLQRWIVRVGGTVFCVTPATSCFCNTIIGDV